MDWTATLIWHHSGQFITHDDGNLEYVGGELRVWEGVETDYINKFVLEDYAKACKHYFRIEHIWFKVPREV